jgi:aspartyl-tRNA(Asn)/glutamyl-tRNA(Gln) amidotransferase subunit A
MARSARDAAILLQAIAGYDTKDPYSVNHPGEEYLMTLKKGVSDCRVALASDAFLTEADAEVLAAVQDAARVFIHLGAHVEEVAFPGVREAAQANGLMVTSDAAAFHRERLLDRPQDFGPDVLQRLQTGAAYTSTEYILARHAQTLLCHQFERFFAEYDILLTPTTPIAAPLRAGEDAVERARQLTRFTAPFNLTGLPALSLPCGFTHGGLPIGLQIVSRPWAEIQVLQAAYAYEQVAGWNVKKPLL